MFDQSLDEWDLLINQHGRNICVMPSFNLCPLVRLIYQIWLLNEFTAMGAPSFYDAPLANFTHFYIENRAGGGWSITFYHRWNARSLTFYDNCTNSSIPHPPRWLIIRPPYIRIMSSINNVKKLSYDSWKWHCKLIDKAWLTSKY